MTECGIFLRECDFAKDGKCDDPLIWINCEGLEVCRYQEGAICLSNTKAFIELKKQNDRYRKIIRYLQKNSGKILNKLIRDRDLIYQINDELETTIKKYSIDLDGLFDFLKENVMDEKL